MELFLVVAASKVEFVRKIQDYTFQSVYQEYKQFVSQSGRTHFRYEKPLCFKVSFVSFDDFASFWFKKVEYSDSFTLKAFEHLIELAIIKPTRTTAQWTQLPRTFLPIHLNVTWSQILGALQTRSRCPAILQQWASGTIDE